MTQSRSDIFTVSKLNRFAKHILESEIGSIWISAEISNFVAASSGHWYFTLKDARAQVKAAMFKGANRKIRFTPKEGDKVLVRGDISLYEARGDYQLIASHMEPEGKGDLKLQFEQLKSKLASEGLFQQEHKQALPARPSRLGVITSPTGAAIRDVLTVLKRRSPGIEVIVFPASVQGATAPAELIGALNSAQQFGNLDAIILGRGGGSMEDLWCFNDELLARSIYACSIPVVSAVGHEIDFTICDFVADLRAATPSAAAELLSYSNDESIGQLQNLKRRMHSALRHQLQQCKQVLTKQQHQLQRMHPEFQIQQQWQRLDALHFSLKSNFAWQQNQRQERLTLLAHRLAQQSPKNTVAQTNLKLSNLSQRLSNAMTKKLEYSQQRFANACHLLDTVSPLATLSRGYSITRHEGQLIKQADKLQPGDVITTQLHQGQIRSKVEKVTN